jgi:hypothetical protein
MAAQATNRQSSRVWRLRAIAAVGAMALCAAAGLGRAPTAWAAPGDDPSLFYDCGNIVFGFCSPPLRDVLSPPAQQELNVVLASVPDEQRPLFIQALQSLGPYGADGTLRVYSTLPPETLNREFSYLSNLIQNFSPDYQRALLIDYFQNQ